MQACKHKHRKLHNHDLRFFAPDMLRDAAPAGRAPAHEDAAYAKLEGLGKIPFSNIRRPRPLMDLMDKPPPEQSEASPAWILVVDRAGASSWHSVLTCALLRS